ncbi:receptor-like protein EIX2 [Cornus florida]|uniref:receptor-like protein EIX2 n=1 Tax=Cornus florida TaxID=4283 RepID=UPI0028A1931B|nr:receptor-like protein EIX2 [Cornus florida]
METQVRSVVVILFIFALVFVGLGVGVGLQINRDDHQSNVSCTEGELKALLKLRESLIDHSNRLSSWVGEYCCTWTGVGCSKRTRRVVMFDLPGYDRGSLQGEISPSILNLRHLHYIDLSNSNFSGTQIPEFLGSLKNLRYLDLSNSGFEREIPPHFGNLSNLQHLNLGFNYLQGPIPDTLGRLSSLIFLDLGNSRCSPIMPSWLCKNEQPCSFGTLCSSLGRFSSLSWLYASDNQLNGSIPSSLGQLSRLEGLDVSNNQLNGSIPSSLGQLSRLLWLDVCNNSLDGVISELHFAKLTSISDTIPDWFEDLYSRNNGLDISHNQICGKLPKFQESNATLEWYLYLNSNKFEGPLTPFLSDVTEFDLSDNLLSGHFPLGDDNIYMNFRVLFISNNSLTGDIPKYICKMMALQILDLSTNKLSGALPWCMGDLDLLGVVDLTNNNLHGHIPSSLGSLQNLYSLHLSHNMIHGKIPSFLQNLTSLSILDLGDNELTDIISSWIGEMSSLRFLILQSNKFYGYISPQLCQLSALQVLDLSHNWKYSSLLHQLHCHGCESQCGTYKEVVQYQHEINSKHSMVHHPSIWATINFVDHKSSRAALVILRLMVIIMINMLLSRKNVWHSMLALDLVSWLASWVFVAFCISKGLGGMRGFNLWRILSKNLLAAVAVKAAWVQRKFHKDEM